MRILILSPYLPHRRVGHGGGTAVRDLLAWLARRHEVTAACLVRPGEQPLVDDVRALGVAVEALPFADRGAAGKRTLGFWRHRAAAAARATVSGYPYFVEKYRTAALAAQVDAVVGRFRPEAVQVEYLQLALHCRDLRRLPDAVRPRLILNTHELGSLPRERRARLARDPWRRALAEIEAARWRKLQVDACRWADRTLCVTPQDHELLAAMGGVRLATVPLGVDLDQVRADWDPPTGTCRFLFVGSFSHGPNRTGAHLLLETVWPRVRAALPEATLDLAGRGSDVFLDANGGRTHWTARGVTGHGYVEDLAPLFRDCRAFVAPLSEGGGIKIKVLEALARGVPVVTSAVGAEGITTEEGSAMLVTPPDAGFADAMLRVAGDRGLAAQLAANGRRLVEDRFHWAAITERLTRIYAGQDG